MRLATAKTFFSRSAQGRGDVEMLSCTHYPLLAGAIAAGAA